MSASVNRVTILGNLGRDPETRYAPNGSAICNLAVATSRSWTDRETNEKREETEWHRLVAFGRTAEIAQQYLVKGRPVYVEGRLRTRKSTDKDGIERYSTEIVVDELKLLGRGNDAGDAGDDGASAPPARPATRQAQPARTSTQAPAPTQAPTYDPGFGGFEDDDIPF